MTYRTVLVGMDFSDAAITAAKWTSQQFAPDASLVLVHAVDLPHRPLFAPDTLPPADVLKQSVLDFATTRLNDVAHFLSDQTVRRTLRRGKPAEVIRDVAREVNADLVVIGPHGERQRAPRFLGSTADRIVRQATISVLVATQPRQSIPKRLLVAVDDADITSKILERVRALSETFDARVTLLHVWSNSLYSYVASMSHATAHDEAKAQREIQDEIQREGERWLETLARTGLDRARVDVLVTHGNAGDETLRVAEETRPDLIVLGRRGSGLVGPALMGSTVATVLHGARCPVLVVADEGESNDTGV